MLSLCNRKFNNKEKQYEFYGGDISYLRKNKQIHEQIQPEEGTLAVVKFEVDNKQRCQSVKKNRDQHTKQAQK